MFLVLVRCIAVSTSDYTCLCGLVCLCVPVYWHPLDSGIYAHLLDTTRTVQQQRVLHLIGSTELLLKISELLFLLAIFPLNFEQLSFNSLHLFSSTFE